MRIIHFVRTNWKENVTSCCFNFKMVPIINTIIIILFGMPDILCISLPLLAYIHGYWLQEDSTPVHVHPIMYQVPRSTCTLHITLCTKCKFLPFWSRVYIFTIQMCQLLTWQTGTFGLETSVSKKNSPLKMIKLFQFHKSAFPTVLLLMPAVI